MEHQSGTPFYNFIYKDFENIFGKNFSNIADLQGHRDISKGQEDFMHIYSYRGLGTKRDNTDVRLYLNLMGKNIIKFSEEFYTRSKEKGLPGYFKFFNTDNQRNDTWLVYSSYENMEKYVEIIESIKRDRPELLEGTEKVSYNMANLDGFIGFGEEPKGIDANGQEKIPTSDDERTSHNARLENVTNNILTNIRKRTLDDIRGNVFLGDGFVDNKDIFGNSNKTFKEYLNLESTPFIEKHIESWLKTSEGIEWANNSPHHNKTSLIKKCKLSFEREFINYLTSNGELSDLSVLGCHGLTIPASKYNWLDYLKKAIPNTNFDNDTITRGYLCQYACFKSANSPKKFKLYSAMKSEMDNYIQSALQKNPNDPTLQTIATKLNNPKSVTGKALAVIASAGLISSANGNQINIKCGNKIINIAENINRYNVYEATMGKDIVEQLAKEECHKNNIDFNRVCFNETTTKQNNIPNNSTSQQSNTATTNTSSSAQTAKPNVLQQTNNSTNPIINDEIKKYYNDLYTSFFGDEKSKSVYGKSRNGNMYIFDISEIRKRKPIDFEYDLQNFSTVDQYKTLLNKINSIADYKNNYAFVEENGKKYYMEANKPETKREFTQDIADAFVFADKWNEYKKQEGLDWKQYLDEDLQDWANKESTTRFVQMMERLQTALSQGSSTNLREYSFLNPSDSKTMSSTYRLLGGFLGYEHLPLNINSNNISYLQENNYFDENGIHHYAQTHNQSYDLSEGM